MSDLYSDDRWLSIRWDAEHRCIYALWKVFANSRELRDGGEKILLAIGASHAEALVSDNRRLVGLTPDDQDWFSKTWTTKAVRIGLRRIAVVLPPQGSGRFDSEDTLGRIGKRDFVTHAFDSVPEALEWIADRGAGSKKQP
jgi:hypothetical protein